MRKGAKDDRRTPWGLERKILGAKDGPHSIMHGKVTSRKKKRGKEKVTGKTEQRERSQPLLKERISLLRG